MGVTSWIRRQFKNGVSTADSLPGGCTSGATSMTAISGTTFPDGSIGNFICTLDQGLATEEKVLMASRSGATFTVASGGRGYNGTTAQAHGANASILHTIDAQDFDEANQVAVATLGAIAAKGDLLVGSAANALAKLSIGSATQFLQVAGGTLSYTSFGAGQSQPVGSANADGTQTSPARSDHVHLGVTSINGSQGVVTGFMDLTSVQTATNKRITRRVVTVTQSATPAIDTDNMDVASITGLAQAITSMSSGLSGTPVDGDTLRIRITDNGTARAITWGASFEGLLLPPSTVASTELVVDLYWDVVNTQWSLLSTNAPVPLGRVTGSSGGVSGQLVVLNGGATPPLQGGMVAHATGAGGLVVPIAGWYQVSGQWEVALTGAGFGLASIYQNGSKVSEGSQGYVPAAGGVDANVVDLIRCAASDLLQLGFATTVGGTFSTSYLSARYVGP